MPKFMPKHNEFHKIMPKLCRTFFYIQCFSEKIHYFCSSIIIKMETFDKAKRILLHIAIWGFFLYIFIPNSFLRPYPFYHPYKEWIIGLILMSFCYFNYFILIPRLYLTGFFKKYWIIFLSICLLFTGLEFLLLFPDFRLIKPSNFYYFNRIVIQSFSLVFIRNGGILSLFFLLKTNRFYTLQYQKEHKTIVQETSYYNIATSSKEVKKVNINDITHIQHQKNYTYFHLKDGHCYSQYISLLKVESELPEGLFERINRSTLINTAIPSRMEQNTLVLEIPNGQYITLPVSSTYKMDKTIKKN